MDRRCCNFNFRHIGMRTDADVAGTDATICESAHHISYDFLRITRSIHPSQISPQSVQGWVCGPNTDNFTKILVYKHTTGAYPLGDFYQIFSFCGHLHVRSCVETWADLLNGFWS